MKPDQGPIIGIPTYPIRIDGADSTAEVGATRAYYDRLLECGALPVLLPLCTPDEAVRYLDVLDGLLMPGGHDVDPQLFGQKPHPRLGVVQRERDDCEIALVRAAVKRGMPLMGICRGIQVINVALGGTLFQDLGSEAPSPVDHGGHEKTELRHGITVTTGSRLATALGEGCHRVNSLHHQAVAKPAPGLTVSAVCPEDGVIEAIELRGPAYLLGIQFHPEGLKELFSPIFEGFVAACAKRISRLQDHRGGTAAV